MKNKKWLMPILALVGSLILISLVTYPMLSMKVKDIPVGILSLDESIETPNGAINAGEEIVKNLTKNNEIINWQSAKNIQELNDNMDKGEYYATFLIPKNFTKSQLSSQDAKIEVVINQGKHPMVSTTLTPMINALAASSGLSLDIKTINNIPTDQGMTVMLLPMMVVLLTIVSSLVTALMTTLSFKLNGSKTEKLKKYLLQLIYMLIASLVISFSVTGLVSWITEVSLDILTTALYLSTVSFSLMLLTNGSVNLFGKKGIVIPALIFIFGMGTIQIPYEYLTSGYQTLIASWEPLKFIGDGIREVLYQNAGLWNSASLALIIMSVLGILLTILKICRNSHDKKPITES